MFYFVYFVCVMIVQFLYHCRDICFIDATSQNVICSSIHRPFVSILFVLGRSTILISFYSSYHLVSISFGIYHYSFGIIS